MLWAIHSSRAVVAADLREHLEAEMLVSLREAGIVPAAKAGDLEVTPERRTAILDAFEALGGALIHARPQMASAIDAACGIARGFSSALGSGSYLVSLRGNCDPAQLVEVSVSLAPEPA